MTAFPAHSSVHLPGIKSGRLQAVGSLLVIRVHPHNLHGDDAKMLISADAGYSGTEWASDRWRRPRRRVIFERVRTQDHRRSNEP